MGDTADGSYTASQLGGYIRREEARRNTLMAKCSDCKKDMMKAAGCSISSVKLVATYGRVRFGAETRFGQDFGEENGNRRCHDCGCKPGNVHHTGCDMEECPQCHGQLISCDCEEL